MQNAAELETALDHILGDAQLAAELGRNAVQVVKENSGAIERTVEMIVEALKDSPIFVAGKRFRARQG